MSQNAHFEADMFVTGTLKVGILLEEDAKKASRMRAVARSRKRFSLMEFLVVIAIITIFPRVQYPIAE